MTLRSPQRRSILRVPASIARGRASARRAAGPGETGPRGAQQPSVLRRGMTLTELLIVIMIMAFLLGAALPIMRTAMDDRAMREASRQLNTYVQLAKSQAAEKGRPVGLWLETEALEEGIYSPSATTIPPRFARQLFLAETPPPYSGDFVGAQAKIYVNTNQPGPSYYARTSYAESGMLPSLVKAGDRIKFDFKGPAYPVASVTPTDASIVAPRDVFFNVEANQPDPPVFDLNDPNLGLVKYQIFRTPQKSSVTPMEFSGGAVVDLSNSGVGLTGQEFASATTAVVIMFSPNGTVDRILGQGMTTIPPATIHLLIGSVGDMMELGDWSPSNTESTIPTAQRLATDYSRNLDNAANLWVSISHQTGNVTTAVNAWQANTDLTTSLAAAREFAQRGLAEGGR